MSGFDSRVFQLVSGINFFKIFVKEVLTIGSIGDRLIIQSTSDRLSAQSTAVRPGFEIYKEQK